MVLFGQKLFYSGKSGSIPAKAVVFVQKLLCSGKVVVFGQKWLYSGKSSSIRAIRLYSGKKWLYSVKVVDSGKIFIIR